MGIGGCGGGFTGEHIVSAGIWDDAPIEVVGFRWCRDQPQTIGSASFVANILCKNHNSALSPVDAEGKKAAARFREVIELGNARHPQAPQVWSIRHFTIDGFVFERWLLKTAINLCCAADSEITWSDGRTVHYPPEFLVRAAFGLEPIRSPTGFYGVGATSEHLHFSERVEFAPIFFDGHLIAGLFNFHGSRFLINMSQVALPTEMTLGLTARPHLSSSQVLFHLAEINYSVGPNLSHSLHFFDHKA